MPIRHGLWLVDTNPRAIAAGRLPSEQILEDMIVKDPSILSSEWMLIGRQEVTPFSGRIDLLAIAPDGSLVLVELKRDRTPRDIVAQALDYASWVEGLTPDKIGQIYSRFSKGGDLGADFSKRFGGPLNEDDLNQSHQIILVASELDDATERIILYLNARDIAINVVFFQIFDLDGQKLLSKAWMIDPTETQSNASVTGTKTKDSEPWNGEYYVSFGGGTSWADARKYGFVSAGGGKWYSQTLKLLKPDDRIWVKIPGKGYVGVGRVSGSVQSVLDFKVMNEGGEVPCLDILSTSTSLKANSEDPDKIEQFVPVQWIDTVEEKSAFQEIGLFGNQNTVCQPRTSAWRHTIERLRTKFKAE